MQKLVIRNQFMGVMPCEIEIKRFLLLIGEQASGKSTIAKLIFFFQTLPDALYETAIMAQQKGTSFDFTGHINLVARQRFLETFGPTTRNEGFEISFYYTTNHSLKISQGSDKKTFATFSESFGRELGRSIQSYINSIRLDRDIDEVGFRQTLRSELDRLFSRTTTQHTYLIAGRNTIVGYPEIFEKIIESEYEKLLEDEVKEEDFEKRQRLGNERLLYQFVQWSKGVRNNFKNNGKTFDRAITNLENRDALTLIRNIATSILKGEYSSNDWGEQITPTNSRTAVALKDASSGQQESLRLIQGLFLSVGLQNRKEFFVVEEPEAHLYPLAQKDLINAFAVFLNTIPQGRMVVTTHSPYVLACINILLMASYVASNTQNGSLASTENIVDRHFWLLSDGFNAYSLGHSENYCINIKDPETGLIDQNYLDTISEQLGLQYQQLFDILT
jgi:AAA ATPase domain